LIVHSASTAKNAFEAVGDHDGHAIAAWKDSNKWTFSAILQISKRMPKRNIFLQ